MSGLSAKAISAAVEAGGRSLEHVVIPSLVHAIFPSLVHVGRLHQNSMACCMHRKQFGILHGLKKVSTCKGTEEGEQHNKSMQPDGRR